MRARLVLADGTVFTGKAIGATGDIGGEVVFNTSMVGYGEILTDPSYCGQIVTLTYPLIGNYGIAREHLESRKPFLRGLIVKELCEKPNNWSMDLSLSDYLKENNIFGFAEVDTRALTKKLRSSGTMLGMLTVSECSDAEILAKVKQLETKNTFVKTVTTPEAYKLAGEGKNVVLMDFGAKENIVRSLHQLGCNLTVVPATTSAEEVMSYQPDGIFLSNGPGDPTDAPYAIETVKKLLGKKPVYGICLGHQLIGLALGGKTYKLKFGHRGANQPVKDLKTGRVYITSQNHGYALDAESLNQTDLEVTHINLNDNTIEGIRHKTLPIASVQYHPEAAPGPIDSQYLFQEFLQMMADDKGGC